MISVGQRGGVARGLGLDRRGILVWHVADQSFPHWRGAGSRLSSMVVAGRWAGEDDRRQFGEVPFERHYENAVLKTVLAELVILVRNHATTRAFRKILASKRAIDSVDWQ